MGVLYAQVLHCITVLHCAIRTCLPVQAEPRGVQARQAQHLRQAGREGGTAQVGVITILFERKKVLYSVRCYLPMLDTDHIQTRI